VTDDVTRTDGVMRALTRREAEVLSLVARGLTNAQIALSLDVSVHAVKFHLGSIFRKLAVANRTEATVAYLQSELQHVD
jgi:DNA-binding NarL/FixJ family response regulator